MVASTSANPSISSNLFKDDVKSNKISNKDENQLANHNNFQFPFGDWVSNLWRDKEERIKMDDHSSKGLVPSLHYILEKHLIFIKKKKGFNRKNT